MNAEGAALYRAANDFTAKHGAARAAELLMSVAIVVLAQAGLQQAELNAWLERFEQ